MSQFFVIEGGEGSGKTTQIGLFKKAFPDALATREPGGTQASEEIRTLLFDQLKNLDPLSQLYLVHSGRIQNCLENIIPALQQEKMVICDRFQLSTYAYQLFATDRLDLLPYFMQTQSDYKELLPVQPFYIYLDIDPKVGVKRTVTRNGEINIFDTMDLSFHEKIREGYKDGLEKLGVDYVIINASESIEHVHEEIKRTVVRQQGTV